MILNNDNSNKKINLEDFILLRDFIHERSGMFFAENKKYLFESRFLKRMTSLGISTYKDYFYKVKYDTSLKEFNMLMNLVTTNETSFYRNLPQLLSFSSEVLPKVIEEKKKSGNKHIKIWSAGCSTGEEPYTLGMILLETLGVDKGWKIEIVANDISEDVLYAARKGYYNELTLRTTPAQIVSKYFKKDDRKYQIMDDVKRLVKFCHLNLNDRRKMLLMKNFDFIFCRNVTIYFSDEVKKQIIKGFYNALKPGSYLYIGHSETLHGISKAFKLIYLKNGLVYNKEKSGTTRLSTSKQTFTSTVGKTTGAMNRTSSSSTKKTSSSDTHVKTMGKLKKIQDLLAKTRNNVNSTVSG